MFTPETVEREGEGVTTKASALTVGGLPVWLLCLFIALLALGTDEFVISGILPDVAADLGVSPGTGGQLVTVFAIAFAFGAPVLAFLTDRFEKKRVLVAALAVFALANVAVAVSDVFAVTIVMRIVAGLAAAAVSPTAMAIAGMAAPPGRDGRYLAVVTAGLTVALFTGVPFGSLLGNLISWRATFVLIAAVSALVCVLSVFLAPSVPGGASTSIAERLAPARNPRVLAMVLAMLLSGAGGLMFYSYLGTILMTDLGASSAAVTWALLIVGVVGVVAVFMGGALSDRFGPRTARIGVLGGHALGLGALATFLGVSLGGGLVVLFVLIGLWAVFAWALSPVMQASIMGSAAGNPMLAMSLGISGLYAGSAIGAAIGGYLIDNFGPGAVPLVGTVWLVVAAGLATVRTVPSAVPGERSPQGGSAPARSDVAEAS